VFVGAAASHYAAFRRALDRGSLTLALAEARELPQVDLADALCLVLLIREQAPARYTRAAARWLARWLGETPHATLEEAGLVLGALGALHPRAAADPRAGAVALMAVSRQNGHPAIEQALRRWLDNGGARVASGSAG
jgi:hypothetical protein